MKLLIILSVIACSCGDKLDRTYLPPENAGTAGGSPGSIAAPGTETELGVPKGTIFGSPAVQTSGPSSFGQPSGPSFGQPTGSSGAQQLGPSFGQPTGSPVGQPSGSLFGKPSGPSFGQPTGSPVGQPSGSLFGKPSGSSFGQPSGPSFGQPTGSSVDQQSGSSFGQPTGSTVGQSSGSLFGKPSGPSFGQPSGSSFDQPAGSLADQQSGPSFSQPTESPVGQPSGPLFGKPSGTSFGQPSRPSFGSTLDQPSDTSFGQNSQPSFDRQGQNQPDQPNAGLIGSQYNQAGNSAEAGTPDFTQTGTGFNNAPGFNSQSQAPTSYNGPTQPERPRASIDRNAETLHYENNIDGDTFAYSFETSNGIAADEAGVATNGVRAQGGFSYTGDDGQFYSVRYTADENGYVPRGDHLPTPHPIPEEILKSLEENARAAAAGTQEGAYNPNEDSNFDSSASYPSAGSNAYQPIQGSASQYNGPDAPSVTAKPQNGQEFDSKYNTGASFRPQGSLSTGTPQYDASSTALNNYVRPGLSDNKLSGSQYGNLSPVTTRPGSQSGNSPTSQYTDSFGPQGTTSPTYDTPTGTINIGQKGSSRPGSQTFSQNRPMLSNQYGVPDSKLPTSSSFSTQDRPSSVTNKVPSFGSSSKFPQRFDQSPVPQTSIFASQNDALAPNSQPSTFPTSGSSSLTQNSGYQYNSPTAFSVGKRPGTQKLPSQGSSSSVPQFGTSAGSPSGQNGQIRPQDVSSGTISGSDSDRPDNRQSTTSQYNRPVSAFSRPQGTSAGQYETPTGSLYGNTGLSSSRTPITQTGTTSTGNIGSRPVNSQSPQSPDSQYNRPASEIFGSVNTNSQDYANGQSGLSQRPQSTSFLKPTISSALGQNNQKLDESGYKYSRPQTQFGQQEGQLSSSRFTPSDSSASLNLFNKDIIIGSNLSGDKYNPSGSIGSTPKEISSASGFPKASSNRNYPSGQSPTDKQNTAFFGADQYSTTGFDSRPTGSTFPRQEKPVENASTYQFGQISASKSPMYDSAPYQYKRPGSQEAGQIGNRPIIGPSGQKRPGQVGSQTTFGSLGQQRPGQTDYQSNFESSAPKRPGQGDSQSTFGLLGEQRPEQVGSQPIFGSSGQQRPGQVDYQSNFESSTPKRPGQGSSQPTFGSSGQQRPGQVGSQPTFGTSGQEKPSQIDYQSTFESKKQERPGQEGYQPTFGSLGQRQPGQIATENQKESGQADSHPGYDYSKQNRPGQTGSQTSFSPSSQNAFSQTGTQPSFGLDKPSQGPNQPNFGSAGQKRPDQNEFPSGSTLGPKGPGQAGYQSPFTSSRQDRPSQFGNGKPKENFNGPRQPPSFSPEEGYKY